MACKAALGLSEMLVGVLLAVPSFDPQATFARLSAEELREAFRSHSLYERLPLRIDITRSGARA